MRHALSDYEKINLSSRWLESREHHLSFCKPKRMIQFFPLASTDDGITVNGAPQASSSSDLEEMRVKLDQSLQGEDIRSGLIQSLHDAARVFELAIKEHSSLSRSPWLSKTWLGVDKNAWVKTLSYQVSSISTFFEVNLVVFVFYCIILCTCKFWYVLTCSSLVVLYFMLQFDT